MDRLCLYNWAFYFSLSKPYTRLKANEWKKLEATGFQTNLPKDWVHCEGSIGDFDDHLEDLGVDWLVNPTIVCPT
jgi:hypothetical protein